ncbi:hypothetical protein BDY19DRAFT_962578 [Irpex rosettiformis]|uniref:Uncharacterized protein n=1 Tax=Irpex rosettiformis TaxID=378272 RepID=A0ACB8TW41_9APHY|nr:hypothetical protein BDY19DRAFT_962578 [Irpex rosettiformis]
MSGQATQRPTPLRGRKKFILDVQDAMKRCTEGWTVEILRVENLRHGEDEGSILCEILRAPGNAHLMSLSIIISDTSDYPNNHSFFCCTTSQGEVAPCILDALQAVPEEGHCSIEALLQKLLASCARRLSKSTYGVASHDDGNSGDYDDYEGSFQDEDSDSNMYDDDDDDEYYGISPGTTKSGIDMSVLRRDFNEIVACDYRPGIVRIGSNEVAVSVSKPAFKLTDNIPPQALSAWDSRLLSSVKHLTLIITGIRGVYPILSPDGTLNPLLNEVTFRVGLTPRYKPDKELVLRLSRTFIHREEEPRAVTPADSESTDDSENQDAEDLEFGVIPPVQGMEGEEGPEESFSFSLSSSLEALMNDRFIDLLQIRCRYGLGWAAAEALINEVHRTQRKAEDIYQEHTQELLLEDREENQLAYTNRLPEDPLRAPDRDWHHNLPLYAFSYLLRRLTLCSRYCLVCYNKLRTNFQALKPYVCDNKLCTYQYYNLNRGPSLEYEICSKPETVDLLVSLAYSAASGGSLHGFPDGLELQVPSVFPPYISVDFDSMDTPAAKNSAVMTLLDRLPSVKEMKMQLEWNSKTSMRTRSLKEMYPDVPPASWQLLRWCVGSCTAQLEKLTSPEDCIVGVGSEWRQYRLAVGAPDAEAKFKAAQVEAQKWDENAQRYPSLYAFHGSPTHNWHSIIRHGLWCKETAHGRAHGDGVYFAKDGNLSISAYSRSTGSSWTKSNLQVSSCVALAEIVNLPQNFRSSHPYFVVQQTDWIVCRYLLVKALVEDDTTLQMPRDDIHIPIINLDPKHTLSLGQRAIAIPNPTFKLERLLIQRGRDFIEGDYDEEDYQVFLEQNQQDLGRPDLPTPAPAVLAPTERPIDDWFHDPGWVQACVEHMLPPPTDASPIATTSLQRELVRMMKEQDDAKSLKDLGWYMSPDFVGDNLFHWIAEVHSFDPALPIARDMRARNVNSIVFEILFPPTYPHSPPFFRILKPRFLPFIHGGGGHVTGGGSMCMDLLTADGWLPSYSISAILLQIKLAISNLDPRPARLAANWDRPYTMQEAIAGYKRAAQAHGWRIPQGIDRLESSSWM